MPNERDAEEHYVKGSQSESLRILRSLGFTDIQIARKFNEWRDDAENFALEQARVKKRYEPEKEAETKERLARIGLLSPRASIEEARRRPVERPPTGGPSEGRREERREDWVRIEGKVKDSKGKYLENVSVQTTGGDSDVTESDGSYSLIVPAYRPIRIVATQEGKYKRARKDAGPFDPPGPHNIEDITLDPEKPERGLFKGWGKGETKIQEHAPIFTVKWFKDNLLKFAIALGLTLLLYFTLYRPTFGALGQNLGFVNWMMPFLFFFIMFFTLPTFGKKERTEEDKRNFAAFMMATAMAIGTFIGLAFFTKGNVGRASFIQWGVPLAVYLFAYYTGKGKDGVKKTLITLVPILLLIGGIMLMVNLVSSGEATQLETYLKAIDVLHLVGVPQETIDNMKDGVRNVLSFLQFKGAEPTKPEAKKIGGFEAIQLKFGSKFNDFIVPTLFARMNYTLPVTVMNPNTIESQIPPVKEFYIDEIFLINASDQKTLCGEISTCSFKDKCETISSEDERTITIEFNNKSDCREVVKSYRESYRGDTPLPEPNPLFPAKIRFGYGEEEAEQNCKNNTHDQVCIDILNDFYTRYEIKDSNNNIVQATSNDVKARYLKSSSECECTINRYYNIMDSLCFITNDKAKIELRSHFNFSVEGKGELIIVKSESDRKLAPKPTITSGVGPLTITTYFIPDVNVIEEKKSNVNMFIQIENDGDGTAEIGNNDINFTSDKEILKIDKNTCAPQSGIFVDKESTTIVCDATVTTDSISGSYLTVPVIVDVNYTYSQEHSTTLNVRKASIPDGVTDIEEEAELNRQFEPLPYYCPTRDVGSTVPLVIYEPPKSS